MHTQTTFAATTPVYLRISDLPAQDQPAYRLNYRGAEALSQIELLALVIGTDDGLEIAAKLVDRYKDLRHIMHACSRELVSIDGIGFAIASRLKAAGELGRRWATQVDPSRAQIKSPSDAYMYLTADSQFADADQEQLRVLCLDTKNRVIHDEIVYQGSVNTCLTRISEILRPAIRLNTPGLIVAHNHPSGDPTPSPEDIQLTGELNTAAELMGIELLDHIIVAGIRYVSLNEKGHMERRPPR